MTSYSSFSKAAEPEISLPPAKAAALHQFLALPLSLVWCGLVAGLLEVAAIVIRKRLFGASQLYDMSHHFAWLIPATNLVIFLVLGLPCGILYVAGAGRARWWCARALFALTLLPMALVAFPQVYSLAWLIVAIGLASWLVPVFERNAGAFRGIVSKTLPVLIAVVLILAASLWISDGIKRVRERSRALPPPGSPNVLLIVMDTVAAGHLDLYGYHRRTSTTLTELAGKGTSFAAAHSSCSWTLPSHATMFTGHWLHELSAGWRTPLDGSRPTLAEYLGEKGYATAGFVANTSYCARDSGLARGFTRYDDFIFPKLTAFKKTVYVSRALAGAQSIGGLLKEKLAIVEGPPYFETVWRWFEFDRKSAAAVNREFLGWLAGRTQPDRPFFAFVNYFEAHYPYHLPEGHYHRFGGQPAGSRQSTILERWPELDKRILPPADIAFAVSAYDDCIADLDEQIGRLTDVLKRRGVLDRTWLVITADHGESFGEHPGVFCHGASLYETEVHVPLVIIPPGGMAAKQVVTESVSLRDLAATIVDVIGQGAGSPFPGRSLARFWGATKPSSPDERETSEMAFAEVVPNPDALYNRDPSASSEPVWPLEALKSAEWSYLRNDGDMKEELFNLRRDPKEERNLAATTEARSALERLRASLARVSGGRLAPKQFNP